MYLKSLELTGFKSFAKRTVLDFNTPITSIVGPNGSGKSNIAESFRFVLGEQSMKSMRGKRTEDLIWNGSPEMGRSNRASVKLVFDNHPRPLLVRQRTDPPQVEKGGEERGRLLNLDFDEVVLERVIYRDASSEYFLNGTQVRLRDIVETLSGAHIGASGHHIISQGEADRVLNASLRERREMIEDALGLKIYQWKREESERKLEKAKENMKQVESLRREIAPHLQYLKKQVEKIEKVQVQKEELRSLYSEYLKREHAYLTVTKEKLLEEEQAPKQELHELDTALSAARKTLEETHGRDAKTKAIIAIEQRLSSLRREREDLSRELGRLEGELAGAQRLFASEAGKKPGERVVPLSEVKGMAVQVEHALEDLEEEVETVDVLRQTLMRIKDAVLSLVKRYTEKDPNEKDISKEIEMLGKKRKELEGRLAGISAQEAQAAAEERELRLAIDKEKDSSRDAEKEMFRIMARQNELRGTLNAVRARLQGLEHLEADFKREQTEGTLLVGREILEYEKVEVKDDSGKVLHPHELALEDRTKQEDRRRKIEKLKIRIEDAGAGGGADTLKEFEEVTQRDAFLGRELSDLEKGVEALQALILELEQKLDLEFQAGIEKINTQFQEFFSLMFGGGSAKLIVGKVEKKARREVDDIMLEDDAALRAVAEKEEASESGIDIEVNLPRKKIKGLMMLSGGERALTSIALLFAMSQVKPPPFIILDETDAALDEANSKKYGDMIENLSKYSQLILITHNRETMSRAGIIYGVTMDRTGVSKLLSIAFEEAVAVAK